jgi:hypothetical protein
MAEIAASGTTRRASREIDIKSPFDVAVGPIGPMI